MSTLRDQLQRIANDFIAEVIAAMRSASLDDLAGESGVRGTRGPAAGGRGRAAAAPAAAPVAARPAKRAAAAAAKGGRRRRATADEVQAQKDLALNTAKKLEPGFSKSDLMKKAGTKEDLGRALSLLVTEGKLTRKGERRLARYWVK